MNALPQWTRVGAEYSGQGRLSWDGVTLAEVRAYALDFRARMSGLVKGVDALVHDKHAYGRPNLTARDGANKWLIVLDGFLAWAAEQPPRMVEPGIRQWAATQAKSTLKWAAIYAAAQREQGIRPPLSYWHETRCELAIIEGFLKWSNKS